MHLFTTRFDHVWTLVVKEAKVETIQHFDKRGFLVLLVACMALRWCDAS
jgi:hypothetical protein